MLLLLLLWLMPGAFWRYNKCSVVAHTQFELEKKAKKSHCCKILWDYGRRIVSRVCSVHKWSIGRIFYVLCEYDARTFEYVVGFVSISFILALCLSACLFVLLNDFRRKYKFCNIFFLLLFVCNATVKQKQKKSKAKWNIC